MIRKYSKEINYRILEKSGLMCENMLQKII